MERLKRIINNINELIKSFTNPIEPEKNFDELALAAGISDADLGILKKSMGGVSWKFDEGIQETKKMKTPKIVTDKIEAKSRIKRIEEKGIERD